MALVTVNMWILIPEQSGYSGNFQGLWWIPCYDL